MSTKLEQLVGNGIGAATAWLVIQRAPVTEETVAKMMLSQLPGRWIPSVAPAEALRITEQALAEQQTKETTMSTQKTDDVLAEQAKREVRTVLTPRNPDGTGGEVQKIITKKEAQQYLAPVPVYRLSDAKRREYEARVNALRQELAGTLTPGQRIRAEQELAHLEEYLALDRQATPDMRPEEERRVQPRTQR